MANIHPFILRAYTILIVCTIMHSACNSHPSDTVVSGNAIQEKEYKLTENGIILRSGPGEQFDKIINKKASQVVNKIQYAEVDKSVTVVIDEVSEQWSKVRVVGPDWLTASHIGWVPTKYLIEPGAVQAPVNIKRKLMIFNDINLMRLKLSENGIGRLREWKSDEVGYLSITDYYRFGESSTRNGMENNLAYYLESENENYVETVKLVLNINNSAEEKQAIEKFIQVAENTFHTIGVHVPDRLLSAIRKKKVFVYEGESFRTEFLLEEGRIETLKLTIFAK